MFDSSALCTIVQSWSSTSDVKSDKVGLDLKTCLFLCVLSFICFAALTVTHRALMFSLRRATKEKNEEGKKNFPSVTPRRIVLTSLEPNFNLT